MKNGINVNVARKWLPLYRDQEKTNLPAFIPLKLEPKTQAFPDVIFLALRVRFHCGG
jgi:transposase